MSSASETESSASSSSKVSSTPQSSAQPQSKSHVSGVSSAKSPSLHSSLDSSAASSAKPSSKSSNQIKSKYSNHADEAPRSSCVKKSPNKSHVVSLAHHSKTAISTGKSHSGCPPPPAKTYSRAKSTVSTQVSSMVLVKQLESAIGAKEVSSKDDMQRAGYSIQGEIASDDCNRISTFYIAKCGHDTVLCKQIHLNKCTPRYKKSAEMYGWKIERLVGSGNRGQPIGKYFVQIYEIFKIHNCVFIYMEECPNKSLYLILFDQDHINAENCRKWISQITKAVAKILSLGISHRFLVLQHILFDANHNVKIVGWSKSVIFKEPSQNNPVLQHTERKSKKNNYLPPECFKGVYNPGKIDMWSVGVILVAMQTNRFPFNPMSECKFSAQWRQFVLKHKMNVYARAACNKTFSINPDKRATPEIFLSQPYFGASLEKITPKVMKTTRDPKYCSTLEYGPSVHVSALEDEMKSAVSGAAGASGVKLSTLVSQAVTAYQSHSKVSSVAPSKASPSSINQDQNASVMFGSNKATSAAGTTGPTIKAVASEVINTENKKSSVVASINDSEFVNVSKESTEEEEEVIQDSVQDSASGYEGGSVGEKLTNDEAQHELSESFAEEEQQESADPVFVK